MKSTRRTQPMRKQPGRRPSGALAAAMRGATGTGANPMDSKRQAQKQGPRRYKGVPGVKRGRGALGRRLKARTARVGY